MRDVAADNRHAVATTDGGEATVELFEPRKLHFAVEGERDDGGAGASAHRGDVAQVALKKFFAGGARWHRVVDVLAVDDGVDGEQLRGATAGDDRAVIADAERRAGRSGAEPAANRGDEFFLAEGGDGLPEIFRERMHSEKLNHGLPG